MPGIATVLMLAGPVILVVGVLLMRANDGLRPTQVQTEGTVLRWDHKRVGATVAPRTLRSLPVVSFTTTEGRAVEGTPRWAADRGIYRTGHRVEVRYDRADPTSFRIRHGWLDRPYAFVVLAGVVITLLTLVVPFLLRTFVL